jgi:hypothetical protein
MKFNKLNNFLSFLLLSGMLLELGLIVLLKVACTLDATWGNEYEVAFGSSLKNNLNLKFFGGEPWL